jgi:hypothetical protein
MKKFILNFLVSARKLNNHVIIDVTIHECKTEVSHSINKSKLVGGRGVVDLILYTIFFFIIRNNSVTDAETLNEFENFVVLRMTWVI